MWNGVIRRIQIDDHIAFPESEVSGDYIRQRVVTDADSEIDDIPDGIFE
jgi:hypothetical protein